MFWTLHTYLPESAARAPTTLSTEWRGNSEGEADTGTRDPDTGCTCSTLLQYSAVLRSTLQYSAVL